MRFLLSSALCTALAVALAGCTPSPSATAEPAPAAGEDARPQEGPQVDTALGNGQGSVTIAGEDAAEDVQRWTAPRVDRQGRTLAQLRRAACLLYTSPSPRDS